eukprot:31168-Pelagococcus_subviridis.AAC.1
MDARGGGGEGATRVSVMTRGGGRRDVARQISTVRAAREQKATTTGTNRVDEMRDEDAKRATSARAPRSRTRPASAARPRRRRPSSCSSPSRRRGRRRVLASRAPVRRLL